MVLNQSDFVLLDHTADLGMEVYGKTLPLLFEKAARALLRIMIGPNTGVGTHRARPVSISAEDPADLMVRWLSEILYLLDGEGLVVTQIAFRQVLPNNIAAEVLTRDFDPACDHIYCEIKAITYHQIAVNRKGNLWEARVFFDL